MTTQTTPVPYVELNDGNRIPQLGFGVFQVPAEETAETVGQALETGYRAIDTAAAYGNEEGVRDGLLASGLDRGDVFITTKLFNDDHGRDPARRAFEESLAKLGGDYVDLYLIHWPIPRRDQYVETWETLCSLREQGSVRSIGVSNFQIEHGQLLDDPVIEDIAAAHDHTPAQVVLRWHVQLGNVVIPKSVTPSRIEENFNVFDFALDQGEMDRLGELDRGERTGPDPDEFG